MRFEEKGSYAKICIMVPKKPECIKLLKIEKFGSYDVCSYIYKPDLRLRLQEILPRSYETYQSSLTAKARKVYQKKYCDKICDCHTAWELNLLKLALEVEWNVWGNAHDIIFRG